MEISELIVDGNHLDAIELLNDRPSEYLEIRKLSGIGGINTDGKTFTEVALEEGTHRLLSEMYLLPDQICDLYSEGVILSLRRLSFWDVPMQQTPIFNLILFSPYSVEQRQEDIGILLSSGYIPTGQDLERYSTIIGRDQFYWKMQEKSPPVSIPLYSTFMGTRYQRYRLLFSTNNKTAGYSWRTILSKRGTYDYGFTVNHEDLLGDSSSHIPPTHLLEIHDSNLPEAPRYVVHLRDILGNWRNPYTNLRLSNELIDEAKLKREFLWMSGFPIIIPDITEIVDMSVKSEFSMLATRLDIQEDDLRRNIWNLRSYIDRNYSSRFSYSTEILCMYCNYLLDSRKDNPITLFVAARYGS